MPNKVVYTTPAQAAECEICEKKSRFICNISHIGSETEATDFITKIRKKYYDAKHNVYAYILSDGNKKYSDDGEPSKTAGLPILDMLEKQEITDVVCVVTRYFGGILLGTGGLVRAYTESAKQGLKSAGTITKQLCEIIEFVCPYTAIGTLEHIIKNSGATIDSKTYADNVTLSVYILSDKADGFADKISETFGITVQTNRKGQAYR